jgi:hypothetical protein
MKTILPFIIISTFLLVRAPAAEKMDDGAKQTEKSESLNSDDPTFRIVKSPDGEAYFPPGKESYYTRYYQAAKLPSMQFKREEKGKVSFRLAILPSFTKPLFLTYSRGKEGASIEIKRIELRRVKDSLEPGDLELAGKVVVGERIAKNLEAEVIEPSVRKPLGSLTDQQRQVYQGMDGCTWILEVSTETDYTMEDVWSPESIGNMDPKDLEELKLPKVDTKWFIEFCDSLLKLSDMKLPEQSISVLLDNG